MPGRPQELIPGQNVPQSYKFNEKTGWPSEVDDHLQKLLKDWKDKPLSYSQHAEERGKQNDGRYGVNIGQATQGRFPDVMKGWQAKELEHNGKDITKVVMRGPISGTHDAVIPIIKNQSGLPFATTAWADPKEDTHELTDLNRVHLPEEFKKGKPPRRRLAEDFERKRPGYQPIPYHSTKSKQRIIDKFGYPGPAQTQEQILPQYKATNVASFINYEYLKTKLQKVVRTIFS